MLVFPSPDANEEYPVKFIAALQYEDPAKIFDILGAVKNLSRQDQGAATSDKDLLLSLLENIFPLLQSHKIVSDCTFDDFRRVILHDRLPCAYCFIRLRMVLDLISSELLDRVGWAVYDAVWSRVSKFIVEETTIPDNTTIFEDKLKSDWLFRRRKFAICPKHEHHRDHLMDTPIKLKLHPQDPFAIMEILDFGMNNILHHPSSPREQWRYADDVQNMYLNINEA